MKQASNRNDSPGARRNVSAALPGAASLLPELHAPEIKPNALGAPRLELAADATGRPRFSATFIEAEDVSDVPARSAALDDTEDDFEEEDDFEDEEDDFEDDEEDEDEDFDDEEDEDEDFDDEEEDLEEDEEFGDEDEDEEFEDED